MSSALLSASGVRKSAGGVDILNGIDAEIFAGDFTVIMGASGSGKSTLLYALSGMDRVSAGRVIYDGQDITRFSERRLARLRAVDFSFVFQQIHMVSNLTIYENILAAGCAAKVPMREVRRKTGDLIRRMGLSETAGKFPAQVSGGEAQRAAIARAVVSEPKILFADEPTGALNKAASADVLNLFAELNEGGLSVLMVTHDKNAALCGNRILYLEDGAIRGELNLGAAGGAAENAEREKRLDDWLRKMKW